MSLRLGNLLISMVDRYKQWQCVLSHNLYSLLFSKNAWWLCECFTAAIFDFRGTSPSTLHTKVRDVSPPSEGWNMSPKKY